MKTVALPTGEQVPAQDMGTWMIGEDRGSRAGEFATLQYGIDLGPGLIAIPKALTRQNLEDNFSAVHAKLEPAVLAELDRLFPPLKNATLLEML